MCVRAQKQAFQLSNLFFYCDVLPWRIFTAATYSCTCEVTTCKSRCHGGGDVGGYDIPSRDTFTNIADVFVIFKIILYS